MTEGIIEVKNLIKHFPIKGGVFARQIGAVRAVDDISLSIPQKHTVGIVGESGCGKSTLARLLNRLLEPSAGAVNYRGKNIFAFGKKQMQNFRQKFKWFFKTLIRL